MQMSMMLKADYGQSKKLTKEYNMQITNPRTANTFIFSEKDLPGYGNRRNKDSGRGGAPSDGNKVRKPRARWSEFRQTVPKQTALSGQVCQEINCMPVENTEYQRMMADRAKSDLIPQRKIHFYNDVIKSSTLGSSHGGGARFTSDMSSFISSVEQHNRRKAPPKATRMPQNELLDAIYDCFKEYTYWPLRTLKVRLQQPESYLKETLEMVAIMLRNGPHAMQWQLKPESREGRYDFDTAKDEAAPPNDMDELLDMDDEENIEMEDVQMS